ncbi:Protein-lysine N-methyltransferase efm4 [Savitreella phatthalungensis]
MLERLPSLTHPVTGRPLDEERAHWVNESATKFKNPWKSFDPHQLSFTKALKLLFVHPPRIPVPKGISSHYEVVKPAWRVYPPAGEVDLDTDARVTWIGHATFVIELPKQNASQARGIRILLDPVFGKYTSPAWARALHLGPKRYSALPCTVDELPEIDIVVISHNHYDHLDEVTIGKLERRSNKSMQYLVGLNNRRVFKSMGVESARVHELDWWQSGKISVPELGPDAAFKTFCLPSQHNSARSLTDKDKSLWCSWLIEACGKRIYFAGDSGYMSTPGESRELPPSADPTHPGKERSSTLAPGNTVSLSLPPSDQSTAASSITASQSLREDPPSHSSLRKPEIPLALEFDDPADVDAGRYPTNPTFRAIGRLFSQGGGIDLSILPIGLYSPRSGLSAVHFCPEDAVDVFCELRSKRALACHYATFRGGLSRNFEDVLEPPRRLSDYLAKRGIPSQQFATPPIGGSITV